MAIHTITKAWTESDLSNALASWSSYKSSINTTEESKINYVANNTVWLEFDITNAVKQMYSETLTNNGFMIITDSPRADQAASSDWWGGLWTYWASSENNTAKNRPKLTIEHDGTGNNSAEAFVADISKGLQINRLTSGQLILSNLKNGRHEISIFNISGKKVISLSKNLSSSSIIDFGSTKLTNGVYIIKLSGSSGDLVVNRTVQ